GSLRAPTIQTLVLVLTAVGVVFGAVDVGVTGAARSLGSPAAAGPLLGIWGVGSMAGGILATRLGGGARPRRSPSIVLRALALGHLLLFSAAGTLVGLGAALCGAGVAIAPTYASVYSMVDEAALSGTVTEAFAWLATAVAVGSAVGAAAAGALVD